MVKISNIKIYENIEDDKIIDLVIKKYKINPSDISN